MRNTFRALRRRLARLRLWFPAWSRLSPDAACELSRGRGPGDDYHDYHDSTAAAPWHFYTHRCRRCGKEFTV